MRTTFILAEICLLQIINTNNTFVKFKKSFLTNYIDTSSYSYQVKDTPMIRSLLILSLIFLMRCSQEYYQEKVEGDWEGEGTFGIVWFELSPLHITFTSDSVFFYGNKIMIINYSMG